MTKKKTTTSNETGLSVAGQFNRADVPNLLEQVRTKILELKGEETDISLITEPMGPFGKIQDITDPATLRGAYAYITKKGEAVEQYNNIFTEAVPTCKVGKYTENGHSVEKWQKVIIAQYKKATQKAELEKLEKVKSQLEGLLSEEDKAKAALSNIADILNS